jgi:mannonate dehydratase
LRFAFATGFPIRNTQANLRFTGASPENIFIPIRRRIRMSVPMKTVPGYLNSTPGIQVGTKWEGKITKKSDGSFEFEEDGINFLHQLGIEWVMVNDPPAHTAEEYKRLREQIEDLGFKIYRLADNALHNMPEITLNLPGRDRKIEEYLRYISNLGEAGIHYSTYAHMGNGIWRDEIRRGVRGGATAGGLNLNAPNKGHWHGIEYNWPLSHSRPYSEEELWENYEYFIKQVVPVAQESKVFIGVHPDDPPGITMAGIPRKIFGTFEGYKRALEIANSPNIGACLCVGCWLQGCELVGSTPEEFIRYFGSIGKLFKIHARNVTAPLTSPSGFSETFPDAGYYNLINVIEALDDVGFDGAIMNDHLISMIGGHYSCEAAFTSYLRGVVDAVKNRKKSQ